MSVAVPVVEVLKSDEIRGLGEHELTAIPCPNDRLILPGPAGDLRIARVLYAEYSGIKLPKGKVTRDQEPTVMVYVELIGRYTGE